MARRSGPHLAPFVELRAWSLGSAAWSLESSGLALALMIFAPIAWRARAVALLLVFDATLMFTLPTLSNRLYGEIDTPAIEFLQHNLGLQRFYTLGPIAPNYGAYFGIASINHNYLPVPRLWTDWVAAHLDSAADPINFTGAFRSDPRRPSESEELRRNLAAYEEVGVKFVVAPAGEDPFAADRASATQASAPPRQVYSDELMAIYELPAPRPYFETFGGPCEIAPRSRSRVLADCAGPATLMRREISSPAGRRRSTGVPFRSPRAANCSSRLSCRRVAA